MIKEIINLPLRFSRFLHILKEKEYIALFHSLTIETVFLSARALELVSEFKTGKNISYIIMQKELDFSEKKSFFSLVERLIEFKMLVPLSCNEGKELNGYQKNYLRNPVINMAYLVLTDACNLRCRYCFVRQDIDCCQSHKCRL
ncbi:hypothetical protein KJ684_01110 [Patescibacteria group bacterium]|nr:hypothetical protein [Patescibacteria group bacterium]